MKQNRRIIIAGILLLVASALFVLSSLQPSIAVPVSTIAGISIIAALATLVRRPIDRARPLKS